MADDGMLINFAVDEAPYRATPSFKGGSWKDRFKAKKAAIFGRRKAPGGPVETEIGAQDALMEDSGKLSSATRVAENVDSSPRPMKKRRVETFAESGATVRTLHHKEKSNSQEHGSRGNNQNRQVISSLFSFNPTSKMTFEESREDNENAVPTNAPLNTELDNFISLGLSNPLAEHLLHKLDIKKPTAIQRSAVSQLIREDTDAFIQAETGSGKTLAYLLPIVQRIMSLSSKVIDTKNSVHSINRHSGLFAVIIAPTRELCKQISVVLEELLRCAHWIVSGIVIGGEKKKSEKARLRKGLNILIATPGRLADHLSHTEVLDTSNVRWLVLDEGDRLMELGFEQDIQKILARLRTSFSTESSVTGLPNRRTTVLCSATLKTNVQKLGEISLKEAAHIQADAQDVKPGNEPEEQAFLAPAQLKQSFAVVPAKLRLVSLVALLKRSFARRGSVMKTIVFLSCADSVDFHFEILSQIDKDSDDKKDEDDSLVTKSPSESSQASFRTSALASAFSSKENPVRLFKLHGSLPQPVRTSTLSAYSSCKDPSVLVCTDVASRGLDLPNVDFVIEYDPPFNKDDHLHRIGRTARAGRDGRAMIFLLPGSEEDYINVLKESRQDGGRDISRHDSTELLKKSFAATGLGGDKDWEERATEWQLNLERWALENAAHLEQARRAYQSHIRAYATHVSGERNIFDMSQLHLGHLAKAFALRDKPSTIKVPGLRPSKASAGNVKAERRANAKLANTVEKSENGQGGSSYLDDTQSAAQKMRSKMKQPLNSASEFNLG